jgi:phospholipid/cholesterol/gamma-HCH transport system substrate-binding protein
VATPTETSRSARRGYYILAVLLVVGVVVFNLPAIRDLTRSQVDIVALVMDAPGVRIGTEVWAEGVKVGRVQGVRIQPVQDTMFVALDLRLDTRATTIVTRGSDVRVVRRRQIGEMAVRISAGEPGDPPLQPGDTLVGRPRISPQELVALGQALPGTLDSLLVYARTVEAAFEARRPRMERAGDQIREVLDAASALADEVERGPLGEMLDPVRGAPARVRALGQRVEKLAAAAERLGERYSLATEDGLAAEVRALNERARAVEASLARVQSEIETGEGFFGRFREDPAIERAIRGVEAQVDSLVAEAWSVALRMFLP